MLRKNYDVIMTSSNQKLPATSMVFRRGAFGDSGSDLSPDLDQNLLTQLDGRSDFGASRRRFGTCGTSFIESVSSFS